MLISLLSDTHSYLGDDVLKHIEDSDEIWHAGDVGKVKVLETLQDIAPVKAVWGNIDGNDVKVETEKDLIWEVNGLKVYMTHIGGYPGRYYKRPYHLIKKNQPDLFICGHSHILKVMKDKENDLIHMNPGACGIVGFHQFRTFLKFEISDGKVENLRAIDLGHRSRAKS